ncbi:hypothetical protein D3C73_1431080 [compost metagenome]
MHAGTPKCEVEFKQKFKMKSIPCIANPILFDNDSHCQYKKAVNTVPRFANRIKPAFTASV